MLLAIDPGTVTGWAVFGKEGRLVGCGLGDPRSERSYFFGSNTVARVVIEHPKIYPGGRTKNPDDIAKLAGKAGEWHGRFEANGPEYVYPHQWKGSTPKEIQHARDWAKLSEAERAVVDAAGRGIAPSKRHNMLDAVGIGLFAVGR